MTDSVAVGGTSSAIMSPDAARIAKAKRDFDAKAGKPVRPATSFERIKLGQNNFIDSTGETARRLAKAAKKATKVAPKERHIAAAQRDEPQYSLELHFSSESDAEVKELRAVTYTEPLINPDSKDDGTLKTASERTYQIRVRLMQHHAGRLFQGVKLVWMKPVGWEWTDGKGDTTYHEFVSNPLVILRIARYESGTKGWRVIIDEWYR